MLFTEARFFVLFAVAFGVYWRMPDDRARKPWLLFLSYVFYGAWDWRFLGLLWLSTGVDYGAGLLLGRPDQDPRHRKRVLVCALAANLFILGLFKYYDFFVRSGAGVLAALGLTVHPIFLAIALPAGVSFYTLQSMGYTIDVYRGMPAERKLVDYALFVAFFPQLVAGPIVRAADLLSQFKAPRRWEEVEARPALALFFVGFVKKAVISDNVAPIVDAWFAHPGAYTSGSAWMALCLYGVQIYGDFSGYSDMALGSAALLGYRLCINFDHPYLATNPLAFWRRWHMSFSTWLRDYLYFPLGGSRGTPWRTDLNIFLTLLLSGLWHGAAWNYVLYGGLHGTGIVAHRRWSRSALYARIPPRVRAAVGLILTFAFFSLCRISFRPMDTSTEWTAFSASLFLRAGADAFPLWLWSIWLGCAALHIASYKGWFRGWWRPLPDWAFAALLGGGWALALALRSTTYRPFLYYRF